MKKRYWKELESEADSILNWFSHELDRLGLDAPTLPPVPISDICALRGLSINAISNLIHEGKKLAGMLDSKTRSISIEATDILGRQHFSIAHELGHYELHWLPQQASQMTLFPIRQFIDETSSFHFRCTAEDMDLRSYSQDALANRKEQIELDKRGIIEAEANQFASFLLMPAGLIRLWAKRLKGDTRRLAYQFEVSQAAMKYRLDRLKIKRGEDESQIQKSFFFRLSDSLTSKPPVRSSGSEAVSIELDSQPSIVVTPETRLRTLISEIDAIERMSDGIILDFSLLEAGDLRAIGPRQALDLALLCDYVQDHVIPKRTIAMENLNLTIRSVAMTSYVSKHLARLGVFDHSHLVINQEIASHLPQEPFTASGKSVLLRLEKIEKGVDLGRIAQTVASNLLDWAAQSANRQDFADFIQQVLLSLTHNIVEHSGARRGIGKGYASAQLDPIWSKEQLTGYQVMIAVGDIGIGARSGLTRTDKAPLGTDFEALQSYLEGPTISQIKTTATRNWSGHLQINSGDTMLSIGSRSTSHLTGLYSIPGLQVIVLATCSL